MSGWGITVAIVVTVAAVVAAVVAVVVATAVGAVVGAVVGRVVAAILVVTPPLRVVAPWSPTVITTVVAGRRLVIVAVTLARRPLVAGHLLAATQQRC